MFSQYTTRTPLLLLLIASMAAVACGHSEEEWQGQLKRYEQLNALHAQEKQAHAQTRADLDAAKAEVARLMGDLQSLGLNVDSLEKKLQAEGSEKQKLAMSLEEMRSALDAYKRRAAQLEKVKQRFDELRKKLEKLTSIGIRVQIRNNRMVILLPGDVLFPSGQDKLKKEGYEVLVAVAKVIREDAQLRECYFQVAGHTDNVPLQGGTFKDNWGLSAMRARQVLKFFVAPLEEKGGGGGLDVRRLHAAGYAETDPVMDNGTPEGRQANRRVELVLMPDVSEMLDLRSLI